MVHHDKDDEDFQNMNYVYSHNAGTILTIIH